MNESPAARRLQQVTDSFQNTSKDALKKASEDVTSTDMDLVDAKIAAAEARTDTKFAQVMGELKAIQASTAGTKATIIGTGIAVVGIMIAIVAYGGQMLGNGLDATAIAERAASQAVAAYASQMPPIAQPEPVPVPVAPSLPSQLPSSIPSP